MKSPTTIKRNIVVVENLKIDNSKKSRSVNTYLDFLFHIVYFMITYFSYFLTSSINLSSIVSISFPKIAFAA